MLSWIRVYDFFFFFFFFFFLFCVYSENMYLDGSPPRARQRIGESVIDRLHRMQSRQVLSERNLLRADLRDAVLLPISQMLLENHWEYLYNCACQIFPRLVREFYGHMIVTQDDDHGLIIKTMVRGQTIMIDPQLISSGVPVLTVSGAPFPDELGVVRPNQVSYLKGSSMESFTLGPTPKIDFIFSIATTLGNGLRVSRSAQQL
jgi:hypothetical protein